MRRAGPHRGSWKAGCRHERRCLEGGPWLPVGRRADSRGGRRAGRKWSRRSTAKRPRLLRRPVAPVLCPVVYRSWLLGPVGFSGCNHRDEGPREPAYRNLRVREDQSLEGIWKAGRESARKAAQRQDWPERRTPGEGCTTERRVRKRRLGESAKMPNRPRVSGRATAPRADSKSSRDLALLTSLRGRS